MRVWPAKASVVWFDGEVEVIEVQSKAEALEFLRRALKARRIGGRFTVEGSHPLLTSSVTFGSRQ